MPQENTHTGEQAKRNWRELVDKISYNGIVRSIPYILFVAILCTLYIANTSRAVSLMRELAIKNKELKELRWQYLDVQSRLMKATSESQLTLRAATIGLKPLDKPPFEIKKTVKPTPEK